MRSLISLLRLLIGFARLGVAGVGLQNLWACISFYGCRATAKFRRLELELGFLSSSPAENSVQAVKMLV